MKKIRKKIVACKNRLRDSFSQSTAGLLWITGILAMIIITGGMKAYFSPCPLLIAGIIAGILVFLVNELLTWLLKLIFGIRRRNVVYWFVAWFCVLFSFMIASQAEHSISNIIASIIVVLFVGLFGRSAWALWKNKKFTPFTIGTFAVSTLAMILFAIVLSIDGFGESYVKQYLALVNLETKSKLEVDKEFASVIATGAHEVVSCTYGIENEDSIRTNTVDLTQFAKRGFLTGFVMKQYLGYSLKEVPVRGKVWYPKDLKNCPILFIVHGNHSYTTQSYKGYDYLGSYLASNGYVVVSVDENSCNDLSDENDARAVLLLENIKTILQCNKEKDNILYEKIEEDSIVIAGHSRGGETVSLAYLFNQYNEYPDNGNIKFDYHFSIKGILAVAPTVDQYTPAEHEVVISDVNYLILQGADDYDVTSAMGEKQYSNVTFTGSGNYIKSMLYIAGANHGQFNSLWGKYDLLNPVNYYLNVKNLMSEKEQQMILKIYTKVFLDMTLKDDDTYKDLLTDYEKYAAYLPKTVYQQIYQKSGFVTLSDFEEDSNLQTASMSQASISTENMQTWSEGRRVLGSGEAGENYVLKLEWKDTNEATLIFQLPEYNMEHKDLTFDIADMREEYGMKDCLDGEVILKDTNGYEAIARISENTTIYPSLPVQLRKLDYFFGEYEYKHQMQTVTITKSSYQTTSDEFDATKIVGIEIQFNKNSSGNVQIDNIGFIEE